MKNLLSIIRFPLFMIFLSTPIYAQNVDFGDDFFNEGEAKKPVDQTKPTPPETKENTQNAKTNDPVESVITEPESPQISKKILGDKTLSEQRENIDQRTASRLGAIGLLDTMSADTGVKGSFRFRLTTGGFSTTEFLNAKADKSISEAQRKESFSLSHVAIAYTPLDFLEVWGSIKGSSYRNALVQPNLMQSFGDSHLGAKISHFWRWFGLGLVSQLNFISDNRSSSINWGATGADFRLLLSFDFKRMANPLPIRFLLDVQYTVENGAVLYKKLSEEPSISYEWGTQAWRYNRMLVNTGLEFPTQWVSPFIEYHIGTPFQVEMLRIGKGAQPFSFEGIPHWLTLGVRAFPLPEIAIDLSYQNGFSNAPATGVMPTPPWSFWFALSYTLDPKPVIIERSVEVKEEKTLGTLFKAQIIEDQSKKPIPQAKVVYAINGLSPQISDENGNINGYALPSQEVKIMISAPLYQSKEVKVKIPKQNEFKVKITLKPIEMDKTIQVKLFADRNGQKTNASLESITAISNEQSNMDLLAMMQKSAKNYRKVQLSTQGLDANLPTGDYLAEVEVDQQRYQIKFSITAQSKEILLSLPAGVNTASLEETSSSSSTSKSSSTAKPKSNEYIKVKGKQIIPNQPILFNGDSDQIAGDSMDSISKLADFLKTYPSIKLKIEVHTHLLGSAEDAMALSQARGNQLLQAFAQNGISKGRLQIKAMGAKKNIASNISQRGKIQNQRILFSW